MMAWDWKKLLQSKETASEDPAPETPDSGELAPAAAEPEHRQTQADKEPDPAQAEASAGIRHTGGLSWETTSVSRAGQGHWGHAGGSLPELLYGNEHKCGFCRGTGQMRDENNCPVCHGNGTVSLSGPAVRCGFCHGGGHVPIASTLTCPVCRGRGVIAVKPPVQKCPDCKGRGRKSGHALYCNLCRGAGVVSSRQTQELTAAAALRTQEQAL